MSRQAIHENQTVYTAGVALQDADVAVIMMHGRGARAHDILPIAQHLPQEQVAYLAPQAADNRWYPHSGFGPLEANEPHLSSAMQTITSLIDKAVESGIPIEKIVIGGFSQGACLSSEYVAQHAQRYGGLFIFSGALMGPADRVRNYPGSFDGMPVFIGGMDQDSWVTPQQFHDTRDVLAGMGAKVTVDIQRGNQHTIRPAEIEALGKMISDLLG